MDFNLSSICDMLGDRIEEYKTTAKKRRIQRGSCAPKTKVAKIGHEMENSVKKRNGVHSRMYASTPLATPSTETKRFSSSAMLSCIPESQTSSTTSRLTGNADINARKLTFDDTEDTSNSNMDEKTKTEESPVSFASATKETSLETIERRRFQRTQANVRRLFVDDVDKSIDECSSEGINCWSENHSKDEQCKTVECYTKYTATSVSQVLTPMNTPKRERLPRKCMNARRLNFGDEENEDTTFVECLPIDCAEETLVQDTKDTGYSTILVLNVGICIRPIVNL